MKLDLACGAACVEGFEGVDIAPVNEKVTHVANLLQFPWPFADESVDAIRCSHFVEHIPMMFWHPFAVSPGAHVMGRDMEWTRHLASYQVDEKSVSLWLKFFDECHRILKQEGTLNVICPHGHSDRAFQDPTHARYVVEASWNYLDRDWRKANGLQHAAYDVSCHFPVATRKLLAANTPEQDRALALMQGDVVKQGAITKYWNMISDFNATFTKPARAKAVVAESVDVRETVSA